MGPQLERQRHLLHPRTETGGEGARASTKGVQELHRNRVWHPPCSAQMLWPQTHLWKDIFTYNGVIAVSVTQPALFKEAGPTAEASLMM